MKLRSQEFAERAYDAVAGRKGDGQDKYLSFARAFPTLLHTCGLAQATAYADAKGAQRPELRNVLIDTAKAMGYQSAEALLKDAREQSVLEYMRISRDALFAASWVKRFAEALLRDRDGIAGGAEDAGST